MCFSYFGSRPHPQRPHQSPPPRAGRGSRERGFWRATNYYTIVILLYYTYNYIMYRHIMCANVYVVMCTRPTRRSVLKYIFSVGSLVLSGHRGGLTARMTSSPRRPARVHRRLNLLDRSMLLLLLLLLVRNITRVVYTY